MQAEKLISKYLTLFVIVLLASYLFVGLKEFLSAFLGAIVFYILFRKFMRFLVYTKKWNKALGAVIIILISFLIVVLPIGLIGIMITRKIMEIVSSPDLIQKYSIMLEEKLKLFPGSYTIEDITATVTKFTSSHIGDVLNSTADIVASLLMMYFFLYFLLVNVQKLEEGLVFYLPFEDEKLKMFGEELVDQTIGNAIGVPMVAAAQGLSAWLAYWIAGVPDAGMYALLTGVASIIPLVGTAIVWVPVAAILLASNMIWQGIFIITFCVVIMTNLDNVVRMIVFKRVGDVHPVITVLGVILGLKYFGLPGLVFGPLLISYLVLLLKIYHQEFNVKKRHLKIDNEPVSGSGNLSQNQIMNLINKYLFFTEKMKQENFKPARGEGSYGDQENKKQEETNDNNSVIPEEK
ncbi:MAG: AI-2E family transporter [Flavobacteriia bacterium]|nr:AI-2E family transporter [Flavobacteriia bacterium]OJX36873.1 MAG: hypothetical protein BGO87_13900 [Flavobacteriia bacterium 40-80]